MLDSIYESFGVSQLCHIWNCIPCQPKDNHAIRWSWPSILTCLRRCAPACLSSQIQLCTKDYPHDWKKCVCAHAGEKAARR